MGKAERSARPLQSGGRQGGQQRGASLLDYAVLVCMVSLCCITAVSSVGESVQGPYLTAASALEGGGSDTTNRELGRPPPDLGGGEQTASSAGPSADSSTNASSALADTTGGVNPDG